MHHSFTGSARKTRQVNLSGRNTSNPWASLPKSGLGNTQPSSSNPVAQAHAERVKRQHERERLNASRRIQKIWRGHSSRRKQKAFCRHEWDENERQRLGSADPVDYQRCLDTDADVPVYENLQQLQMQIRLLLQFQEFKRDRVRDDQDTSRLLYLGAALPGTRKSFPQLDLDQSWRHNLSRLGLVVARHLRSTLLAGDLQPAATCNGPSLMRMIIKLSDIVPGEMVQDSAVYFELIKTALQLGKEEMWKKSALDGIFALLTAAEDRNQRRTAYVAFATTLLSGDSFAGDEDTLYRLTTFMDMTQFADALAGAAEDAENGESALDTTALLWQLAYVICLHSMVQKRFRQRPYIEAVSTLLGLCANEIAERLDLADQPMFGDGTKTTASPLPTFVRKMVSKLPQQENVKEVLENMGSQAAPTSTTKDSEFETAKSLANFAVALLRAFPSRAQNIRMYLYQASIRSVDNTDMSTIQYFWGTAQKTAVFQKATQNYRNVLSLLKEAAPESNQIGQAPTSRAEIAVWRDEWRVILLFLELYTFVLKFMDDDDFFALDKSHTFGATTAPALSLLSRKGALPLEDVAVMTTFLKNLAFVLYWHAAELVESNENEEDASLSALFGNQPQRSSQPSEKKQQNLTGNGVSQGYLKGLITALLRMLHERDSRRSFVPSKHWLMTSQVNMAGFIPAVVAEEEKRHEMGGEDEGEDEEDDIDKAAEMDISAGSLHGDAILSTIFGIRPSHTPRTRASRQVEHLERQRMQARKKRQLEALAPRLEILRNLPFFIPFETRVQIFREFVYRDQLRRRDGAVDPDAWRMSVATGMQGRGPDGRPLGMDIINRHHAKIHRESVFEDAYDAFYALGEGLKEPIQITFIDKFGAPEAGIDGGGVTKEFLMSVTQEAFDPDASLSMFKENAQRYLYPNPLIYQETAEYLKNAGRKPNTEGFDFPMAEFLRRFQFLGRVVGKCLYEGILIDVTFAGFFLLKWALTGGTTVGSSESAYRATINDVREYDEELYQGLLKLKNYPGDVEADFALDFTVTDTITMEDDHGKETHRTVTTELVPNGANTPVTNTNRLLYIDRIVRYKLQQQPKAVTDSFLKGLGQIVQPMWLAMFNQKELQNLVGGDNSELDIADLRRNTQYGGLYTVGDDGLEHPTVQLFWKALQDMTDGDRRKVLKFVTSTPRAPLLGFSHLNPKFSIRDSSEDQARLPSTSTCVNLLKLPRYGNIKTMKEKLLYAVNSGAGFDLS